MMAHFDFVRRFARDAEREEIDGGYELAVHFNPSVFTPVTVFVELSARASAADIEKLLRAPLRILEETCAWRLRLKKGSADYRWNSTKGLFSRPGERTLASYQFLLLQLVFALCIRIQVIQGKNLVSSRGQGSARALKLPR